MAALENILFRLSPMDLSGGNPTDGGFDLDAEADQLAFVFQAAVAEDIARVGFQSNLTGTSPTYKVSIQGISTSVDRAPDGTIKGGGSPASTTFSIGATGWTWVTLDNVHPASLGEQLAIVFEHDSGTIGTGDKISIRCTIGGGEFDINFPFAVRSLDTGSTWSKVNDSQPAFAYGDTGTVQGRPMVDAAENAITIDTNGHRACNKFTMPTGMGDTFKIAGIEILGFASAASSDIKFGIWNDAGTELASVTVTDNAFGLGVDKVVQVLFTSQPILNFGTIYYVGAERIASTVFVNNLEVDAAGSMAPFPLGTNCHMSTWNGSEWSDTTTKRLYTDLLLADVTQPAASGGGGARLKNIGGW